MLKMIIEDWSQWLETPTSNEDLKKRMRKLKKYFLIFFVLTILILFGGLSMITTTNTIEDKLTGLFIAIVGFAGNCLVKIWAQIKISSYKILWEMNNRFEGDIQHELHRSQAQDL